MLTQTQPKPGTTFYRPTKRPSPSGMTTCLGCGEVQPDEGTNQTCCNCAIKPLPSRSYPESSKGLHIYT